MFYLAKMFFKDSKNQNEISKPTSKLIKKIGEITYLDKERIIINKEDYFICDTSPYSLGQWIEYYTNSLHRVEEICNEFKEEDQIKDTFQKSLVVKINRITGENVTTLPLNDFSLNDVSFDFIPKNGDWINLIGLFKPDSDSPDLTGDLVTFLSFHPLRFIKKIGFINSMEEKEGIICNDIYFHTEYLILDGTLTEKKKYLVEAIESKQKKYIWRAISIKLYDQNESQNSLNRITDGFRVVDRPISKSYKNELKSSLTSDKYTISPGESIRMNQAFPNFRLDTFSVPSDLKKLLYDPEFNRSWLEDKYSYLMNKTDVKNYRMKMHTLLYLEEIASQIHLLNFTIKDAVLTPNGLNNEYLVLEIPDRDALNIIIGDKILAKAHYSRHNDQHKSLNEVNQGIVHKIIENKIFLKFHRSFQVSYARESCRIEFQLNRTPFRFSHNAIDSTWKKRGSEFLFPREIKEKFPQANIKFESIVWYNTQLNNFQKQAVYNALIGKGRSCPYIIFGPPGTGKTMTLVELILQIFKNIPSSRILVATPNNSAANLLCERLLQFHEFLPGEMVRAISYQYLEQNNIPHKLRPYCSLFSSENLTPERETKIPISVALGRQRIQVGTCITLSRFAFFKFPDNYFTHLLIDEAGHLTEPEALSALTLLDAHEGQMVLAGDPFQLGPYLNSQCANSYGLGISFLERLCNLDLYYPDPQKFPDTYGFDPILITKLINNYRSIETILKLPNKFFYGGDLISQVTVEEDTLFNKKLQKFLNQQNLEKSGIIFHCVVGDNFVSPNASSIFNPKEVFIAMDYLIDLFQLGFSVNDIGIITPYRQQKEKLQEWSVQFNFHDMPKIGTVEEFQGQEKKIIILSTVASSIHKLKSFILNPKRMNVTITRAKYLFIIVGDPYLLTKCEYWNEIIDYCKEMKMLKGSPFSL